MNVLHRRDFDLLVSHYGPPGVFLRRVETVADRGWHARSTGRRLYRAPLLHLLQIISLPTHFDIISIACHNAKIKVFVCLHT